MKTNETTIDNNNTNTTASKENLSNAEREMQELFLYRQKLVQDIKQVFTDINTFMRPFSKAEGEMSQHYADLTREIAAFKDSLLDECSKINYQDKAPLDTANKLKKTIEDVYTPALNLDEKLQSITNFRNEARNALYSRGTKLGIGFLTGALIGTAVSLSILITAGVVGVVPLLFSAVLVMKSANLGFMISSMFCDNQNDKRGCELSSNLLSFAKQRDSFFANKSSFSDAPSSAPRHALMRA